jgi:hypothetical protein
MLSAMEDGHGATPDDGEDSAAQDAEPSGFEVRLAYFGTPESLKEEFKSVAAILLNKDHPIQLPDPATLEAAPPPLPSRQSPRTFRRRRRPAHSQSTG